MTAACQQGSGPNEDVTRPSRNWRRRLGRSTIVALCAVALAGCGTRAPSAASAGSGSPARTALTSYLRQIEPLRLAVNSLLNQADPILDADHDRRISATQAGQRMNALERRFAAYTVDVAAITPATPTLRALQDEYAHTYILEDAYLSALASGLSEGELQDLPDTQSQQRAAIIQWRTGLAILARQVHATLPADLQQAGRGEIAPSPNGS